MAIWKKHTYMKPEKKQLVTDISKAIESKLINVPEKAVKKLAKTAKKAAKKVASKLIKAKKMPQPRPPRLNRKTKDVPNKAKIKGVIESIILRCHKSSASILSFPNLLLA